MDKTTDVGMWFMWFNTKKGGGVENETRQDEGNMKRENNSSRHQSSNIIHKGKLQWRERV